MPNRSDKVLPSLPVVYEYVQAHEPVYPTRKFSPGPLQVYDVTYLHFHNLIEIALCVEGEGICYVDGKAYPFRAGDVQIVFPFQRHLSKSVGSQPSQWYWLNVDAGALLTEAGFTDVTTVDEIISQEMGVCGIIDREKYPQICELAVKMIYEVYKPQPDRLHRIAYYSACFYMLLMELCQVSGTIPKIVPKRDETLKEIAPALLAIRNAVNTGLLPEVSVLPGLCGMSTASFRRKFKAAVKVSAKDYITACCIHRACRLLLSTNSKVIEIAVLCGFLNVSGFNRSFLKYTGMTPSEFRRRN